MTNKYDKYPHAELARTADLMRTRQRNGEITQEELETEIALIDASARTRPQNITGTMGG